MCIDCDLSATVPLFTSGYAPPHPPAPLHKDRFEAWKAWWDKVLSKKGGGCVLCPLLLEEHRLKRQGVECDACCGTCGGRVTPSTYDRDEYIDYFSDEETPAEREVRKAKQELLRIRRQRGDSWTSNCLHEDAEKRKKQITIPSLCHHCWVTIFPCRAVSFLDRRAQVEHFLATTHRINPNETGGGGEYYDYFEGTIYLDSLASDLDYDDSFMEYHFRGGTYRGPAADDENEKNKLPRVRMANDEDAAKLMATRYFIRTKTDFPELLKQRLTDDKVKGFEEVLREAVKEKDETKAEGMRDGVRRILKRSVAEAEDEALRKAGGVPDKWPWIKHKTLGAKRHRSDDDDDSTTSYLSDRHPYDPLIEQRVDSGNIMWYEYEKCRGGCYRQHRYDGKHDCGGQCGLIFCPDCAKEVGGSECGECSCWVCRPCAEKMQSENKAIVCRQCAE